MTCVEKDKLYYEGSTSGSENDEDSISPSGPKVSGKPLLIYGFVYMLLNEYVSGNILESKNNRVDIEPKTDEEIRRLLESKSISDKRPIFIIDECVEIDHLNSKKIRFIKNSFRIIGFGLVLLGTDSRAAQLPSIQSSSSRDDVGRNWCYIFNEYPSVDISLFKNEIPENLRLLFCQSRPYFAQLASIYMEENQNSFNLDDMLFYVFRKVAASKKILLNHAGRMGQLRLFLNSCADLKILDSSSKHHITPLIHSHFAIMKKDQIDEKFVLITSNGFKENGKSWRPTSVFPAIDKDVLLYLALMGGKSFSPFSNDFSPSFSQFILSLTEESFEFRSNILSFWNAIQSSKDGSFLETILSAAVCVASHIKGVSGVFLKDFLFNLFYHLDLKQDRKEIVNFETTLGFFSEKKVPFLSPPNQTWPDFLKPLGYFGNLWRTKNSDKIDLNTDCGISGESKDYTSPIHTGDMKKIIIRIPDSSYLHIIISRKFAKTFFSSKTGKKADSAMSYQEFISASNIKRKYLFYQLKSDIPSKHKSSNNDDYYELVPVVGLGENSPTLKDQNSVTPLHAPDCIVLLVTNSVYPF